MGAGRAGPAILLATVHIGRARLWSTTTPRGPTVAPHNAYRTHPGEYNDWCAIVCQSDEEWQRLVQVMGAPSWAASPKFATVTGRLQHQEELDDKIEAWSMTLGKYQLTERCQASEVRALPVQSAEDRVEHDPQLRHREMYLPMEHPALGLHKVQNAPFKLSETPASNHLPSPLIGQHTREIVEGLLGYSHEALRVGFDDGTFWPTKRARFADLQEMLRLAMTKIRRARWQDSEPSSSPMKRASSAASFSAISAPTWSRSNPPVASPTATSGRSSTTSRTRNAVCLFGITIRPNAASPSVWKLPTAGRFSGVWRRHRTSFWKPFGRASRRRWGSITNHCANKTPG